MPTPETITPLNIAPIGAGTVAPAATPAAPPVMTDPFRQAMAGLQATYEQPKEETGASTKQMQEDIWRNSMQLLPQNTGGSQLNIYGNGVVDKTTGKQGQVDPAVATARLQSVYALRPDLIWPGQNPNGTIQREFTGDRYDR